MGNQTHVLDQSAYPGEACRAISITVSRRRGAIAVRSNSHSQAHAGPELPFVLLYSVSSQKVILPVSARLGRMQCHGYNSGPGAS